VSARDSSDDESWDKPSEEDLPAISPAPHRSFGIAAAPKERALFRESTTLRYEGLPSKTRAAAARLASDRPVMPGVRPQRRSDVFPSGDGADLRIEDPALIIESLNPHLAWLAEDRRPALNAQVLRGDLDGALAMLREELRRYPKNLSIARSVQIIERAAIFRLNRKLEPIDRVVSIVLQLTKVRESGDTKKIIDMVDGTSTLEDVIRRSPLKRLETLATVSDLLTRGVLSVPSAFALRGHRDPRVEDSNPGRRDKPAPNPVRMARLAKQLGMDMREELDSEELVRERAAAIDSAEERDDGDRTTLSDPIETEARAALTRADVRTKRPPPPPLISREEPDEPPEIRVESVRPARSVSIAPPEPQPITVRAEHMASVTPLREDLPLASSAPPKAKSTRPAAEVTATVSAASFEERDDKPSKFASPLASKRFEDDDPRASGFSFKPLAIALAVGALAGGVYFATADDPLLLGPAATAIANRPTSLPPSALLAPPLLSTTGSPVASSTAPDADTIKLHIDVSPDYAKVTLDGKKVKTRYDGTLPKDGAKHVLKIDAPGHKQKKIEFVASADTNLVIALEALSKAARPRTGEAPSTAAPVEPPPDPSVYD